MTQQKTTNPRRPRAWSEGEIQALARTPSARHDCPTVPGLFMRVSPQLKAVWAYRFKHNKVEHPGTLGDVLTDRQLHGLSFETAAAAFADYEDSVKNPRTRTTLEEAFQDYLKNHRNKRTDGALAPRTRQTYERLYTYNLTPYAGVILQDAAPRLWRDVLQTVRDRSPHQGRQTAVLLHSIHSHLVKLKELPENPIKPLMASFDGKDLKTERKGHVPMPGLPKFMKAIKGMRGAYQDAPLLLTLTGWRMGAVLRMRWDELDLDNGAYRVPTQTGVPGCDKGEGWKGYVGTIALSATVVELLRARREKLKAAGKLTAWVFPARHGEKEHAVDISAGIEGAGTAAGVELSPHDMRRTWSTAAYLAGVNALTISRLTGHKHTSTNVAPENAWTQVGAGYIVQQLRAERADSELVASLLMELGGLRPVSEEVRKLLARNGLDLPEGVVED
ncbi:MAG: tyrosine-type recombinase/integrase [Gammaproteobacteria bacterium]|nr:tyrosine-type recombinase/integrase [Gammaproteobacteria bacterium]MBU4280328.1 tyrosine-type recombinase/integrase [Gammaproteobacteria bacterium]MBU4507951.1 tyrosine-type recombinase/integrase [Gammaproteobacteria bacterium]